MRIDAPEKQELCVAPSGSMPSTMSDPNWDKWWREVRRRVDARKNKTVTLTIEEIRQGANCGQQNIDRPWWWEMVCDAKTPSGNERLSDYGLACQALVEKGAVFAVTFTLAK